MISKDKVKIIAGPKSWIEGEAIAQLERTAGCDGITGVYGMPDLHPGPGTAVGATYVSTGRIYPHLIGADIGCGMGLWGTTIKPGKPDRIAKRLKSLEYGVEMPEIWLAQHDCEPCGHEHSLGTIGRGNHFAELLIPDVIINPARYNEITDAAETLLLVHSGSRGFGEELLHAHTACYQDHGLGRHDADFSPYLHGHEHALKWAATNRAVIAGRILDSLGAFAKPLLDVPHNFLEGVETSSGIEWYHRKGAIPSNRGPVVIPGSRGAHSYLVDPIVENAARSGYSLAHGAGRKMSRKDARVKFNAQRDSIKKLERTKFNSVVICEDRELLMEEAPEAYKGIDRVVQDLVDHDLVTVIAMLKPILTYKYRRGSDHEC